MVYIMLSGFPPFWGSSDQAIFARILHHPVVSERARVCLCACVSSAPSPSTPTRHADPHPPATAPLQDFDYQPWPQVSDAAKDFVRRLLDKQPEARMKLGEALEHPWIT